MYVRTSYSHQEWQQWRSWHDSSSTHHTAVFLPLWGPVTHPRQTQACSHVWENISNVGQQTILPFVNIEYMIIFLQQWFPDFFSPQIHSLNNRYMQILSQSDFFFIRLLTSYKVNTYRISQTSFVSEYSTNMHSDTLFQHYDPLGPYCMHLEPTINITCIFVELHWVLPCMANAYSYG